MALDIAQLVIEVDTRQLGRAEKNLDKFGQAAQRAANKVARGPSLLIGKMSKDADAAGVALRQLEKEVQFLGAGFVKADAKALTAFNNMEGATKELRAAFADLLGQRQAAFAQQKIDKTTAQYERQAQLLALQNQHMQAGLSRANARKVAEAQILGVDQKIVDEMQKQLLRSDQIAKSQRESAKAAEQEAKAKQRLRASYEKERDFLQFKLDALRRNVSLTEAETLARARSRGLSGLEAGALASRKTQIEQELLARSVERSTQALRLQAQFMQAGSSAAAAKAAAIMKLKGATDQAVASFLRAHKELDTLRKKTDEAGDAAKRSANPFATIGKSIRSIFNFTVGFGLFNTIATLSRGVFDVATQLDRTRVALEVVSPSAGAAQAEFERLKNTAVDLRIPLFDAVQGFTQFKVAAQATNLTTKQINQAFNDMQVAIAGAQLPADQAQGVFRALTQIMSKGKVQAEELRGQLGDRLPGAFQFAAEAMGVTTAELDKMLKTGQVISEDFIPKFSARLAEVFGAAAQERANTLTGAIQNMRNAFSELAIEINKAGLGEALTKSFNAAADAIRALTANLDKLKFVLIGIVSLGIGRMFGGIAASALAASRAVTVLGATFTVLSGLLAAGKGLSFIFGGVPGLVLGGAAALAGFALAAESAEDTVERLSDATKTLKDSLNNAVSGGGGLDAAAEGFRNTQKHIAEMQKELESMKTQAVTAGMLVGADGLLEEEQQRLQQKIDEAKQTLKGWAAFVKNTADELKSPFDNIFSPPESDFQVVPRTDFVSQSGTGLNEVKQTSKEYIDVLEDLANKTREIEDATGRFSFVLQAHNLLKKEGKVLDEGEVARIANALQAYDKRVQVLKEEEKLRTSAAKDLQALTEAEAIHKAVIEDGLSFAEARKQVELERMGVSAQRATALLTEAENTSALRDAEAELAVQQEITRLMQAEGLSLADATARARAAATNATLSDIDAIKQQIDIQKKQQKQAEKNQKTVEDFLSKNITRDFASGFGKIGAAMGQVADRFDDLIEAFSDYNAARKAAEGDTQKLVEIEAKHQQNQISMYGDMVGAAKGFFKEGSRGWKALQAAEQAYRLFEFAMQAKSVAIQLAADQTKMASSAAVATVKAGEAAANTAASVPFPGNIAAVATVVAMLAALGVAISGGGGGGSRSSAKINGNEVGSQVRGGGENKLVENLLDRLVDLAEPQLQYTSEMVTHLSRISAAMTGLDARIRDFIFANSATDFLTFDGTIGQLASGTGTSLEINEGFRSTFIDDPIINNAVAEIFSSAGQAIFSAVGALGGDAEAALQEFFSLDLSGTRLRDIDAADLINDILSEAFRISGDAVGINLERFTLAGESAGETLLRVGAGIESASFWAGRLGVSLGSLEDVPTFAEDIGVELLRLSIVSAEAGSGIGNLVDNFQGGTEDLAEFAKTLFDARDSMKLLGFAAQDIDADLLQAAGGFDSFVSALQLFEKEFFSESEQFGFLSARFADQLSALGLEIPETRAAFIDLVRRGIIPLDEALISNADAFFDYIEGVNGVGASLEDQIKVAQDELRTAYEDQRRSLEQAAAAFERIIQSLTNFRKELEFGDIVRLSPVEQRQRLEREFNVTAELARGGDLEAAGRLEGLGRQLLDASAATFATGSGFFRDLENVRNTVDAVVLLAGEQMSDAEMQLAALQEQVGLLIDIRDSSVSVEQAIANLVALQEEKNEQDAAAQEREETTAVTAIEVDVEAAQNNNERLDRLAERVDSLVAHLSGISIGTFL